MEKLSVRATVASLAGIVLVTASSIISYLIVFKGLYLLDKIRGTSDNWLQRLFVELVSPGLGAYIGHLIVYRVLSRADEGMVKGGFIGLVMTIMLIMIVRDVLDPASLNASTNIEIVLSYTMFPSFIFGAVLAYRE